MPVSTVTALYRPDRFGPGEALEAALGPRLERMARGHRAAGLRPAVWTGFRDGEGREWTWTVLRVRSPRGGRPLAAVRRVFPALVHLELASSALVLVHRREAWLAWPVLLPPEEAPLLRDLARLLGRHCGVDVSADRRYVPLWVAALSARRLLEVSEGEAEVLADAQARHLGGLDALPLGTQLVPPPWRRLLRRLASCRGGLESLSPFGSLAPEDVIARALGESGTRRAGTVTRRPLPREAEPPVYALSHCPLCKGRGRVYLDAWGRLFHLRGGCVASRGGVPLHRWWRRGTTPEPSPGTGTLEDARRRMAALAREVVSRPEGDHLLVQAPPGAGKSYAFLRESIRAAARDPHLRVLYTTASRRRVEEAWREAREFARRAGLAPGEVAVLTGRNPVTCPRHRQAAHLLRRGWSPAEMLCLDCPWRGSCEYHLRQAALEGARVVLATHHAVLASDHGPEWKVDLWVADEWLRDALLDRRRLVLDDLANLVEIMRHRRERRAAEVLERILALAPRCLPGGGRYHQVRLYTAPPPVRDRDWLRVGEVVREAGLGPEDLEALRRALERLDPGRDAEALRERRHLAVLEDPNLDLFTWLRTLWDPRTGWTAWMEGGRRGVRLAMCTRRRPRVEARRMVVLDATPVGDETERLLGTSLRRVTISVEEDPSIHVHEMRRRFTGKRGTLSLLRDHRCLRRELYQVTRNLPPWCREVLVVTHRALEDAVASALRRVDPRRRHHVVHFHGGFRGTNAFRDCDAVILLGTPRLPPAGTLDEELMLFGDRPARGDAWRRRRALAELEQCLHRIRPLEGRKFVYVVGALTPPGVARRPPRGRMLREALRRLEAFFRRNAFVTREVAALLGIVVGGDVSFHWRVLQQVDDLPGATRERLRELMPPGMEPGRLAPIVLSRTSWKQLLGMLRSRLGLPSKAVLRVKLAFCRNQWTAALGSRKAACRFLRALGAFFDPRAWRRPGGTVLRPEPPAAAGIPSLSVNDHPRRTPVEAHLVPSPHAPPLPT